MYKQYVTDPMDDDGTHSSAVQSDGAGPAAEPTEAAAAAASKKKEETVELQVCC